VERLIYFNTSFDASLAGDISGRVRRIAAEIGVTALLAAENGDRVVLDCAVDQEYLDYLQSHRFSPLLADELHAELTAFPWGWDLSAEQRLAGYGAVSAHPQFDVVKNVNSRRFSSDLARSINAPAPGTIVYSMTDALSALKMIPGVALVKPVYGSSGVGHLRIDKDNATQFPKLEKMIVSSAEGISIEPFLDRIDDFAVNFTLEQDSSVSGITFHQGLIDSRGTFRGIMLYPDNSFLGKWYEPLCQGMDAASKALHGAGYFGPVGIDSFTYNDGGTLRINALCEINARLTMGSVARGCRKTLGGVFSVIRQIKFPLRFPREIDNAMSLFGELGYNPDMQKGIFLASPLSLTYESELLRPAFLFLYIAADSQEELARMNSFVDHLIAGLR
jgi:hypothetical protein